MSLSLARKTCGLFALLAGSALFTGCQSTQSKSEEIAAKLGPVKEQKGLVINQESKDVEVLESAVLNDANGTAVVVEVENKSNEALANVPVAVDVVDAKGKSLWTNESAELSQPTLTSIPLLMPGETLSWVNDQVFPTSEPKDVKVTVGVAESFSGEVPDVEIDDEPKLENDSISGIFASATATNNTDEQHELLTIFGIARDGDEVVAAGRAAVEQMNPGRSKVYKIFFIGDPKGADITVHSFPTLPGGSADG